MRRSLVLGLRVRVLIVVLLVTFPTLGLVLYTEQDLRRSALVGLGAVTVLALAAAWFRDDLWVLQRVSLFARAAERLGAGDLAARADDRGRDEIGVMGAAFNAMADRIAARVEAERRARAEAERALAVQTAELAKVLEDRRRAVEAVGEREEQLRNIVASAPDAIIATDDGGRIVSWNSGARLIFGYAEEEILGEPLTRLILRREWETNWAVLRRMLTDERVVELDGLRHDGTPFPMECGVASWRTPRGLGIGLYVRDITRRRQVEEQLREVQGQYRALLDSTIEGLFGVDRQGRCTFINKAGAEMLGYAPQDLLGRDMHEVVHPRRADGQPYPIGDCPMYRTLETGRGARVDHEVLWRRDGRPFWAEYTASPIADPTGVRGAVVTFVDITARKEAEERRLRDITLLNQLGELLQTCLTVQEAHEVLTRMLAQFFPEEAGAVFVIDPKRHLVECVQAWGPFPVVTETGVFAPQDCWALRRGQTHVVDDPRVELVCGHVYGPAPTPYLCVPMIAQGETHGILHVSAPPGSKGGVAEAKRKVAAAVAEHGALAIASLKLRETLRGQSIRDPLTGLFNRRYLEETVERELRRGARSGRPVGFIFIDIDYFKRLNDRFGHEAGDEVLRALGQCVSTGLRAEDIACRYGGEEFVLVLPDATLGETGARAEQLRKSAQGMQVICQGQALGPITISLGVAAFPEHGSGMEDLIRAADAALYRAKKEGRNRVVTAPTAEEVIVVEKQTS